MTPLRTPKRPGSRVGRWWMDDRGTCAVDAGLVPSGWRTDPERGGWRTDPQAPIDSWINAARWAVEWPTAHPVRVPKPAASSACPTGAPPG